MERFELSETLERNHLLLTIANSLTPALISSNKKERKHVCRNDIACSLVNFAGATIDRALCYSEQGHGNARAACRNPDLDRPIVHGTELGQGKSPGD